MIALTLSTLGAIETQEGYLTAAHDRYCESLSLAQLLRDQRHEAIALLNLGDVAQQQRNREDARRYNEQAFVLARRLDLKFVLVALLCNLGWMEREEGHAAEAAAHFTEGVTLSMQVGLRKRAAENLAGLAGVLGEQGQPYEATRLFSLAQALLRQLNVTFDVMERSAYERDLASVQAQLSESDFAAAWAQGQAMTLEQAHRLCAGSNR